jgi:glutamate-ammonia-ligase adenylyltransferase
MIDADSLIDHALRFSRYGQRLLQGEPGQRELLRAALHEPWGRAAMEALLATEEIPDEAALKRILRMLKKRVYLRLLTRDLAGLADLDEVLATISMLADVAVTHASTCLDRRLRETHGTPMGAETGSEQELIVVAMGKLGGGELNVSSDIDLIYVYPEDGETTGPRKISNHEYFTLLGRKLSQVISEVTADGYVFRVDLRLRPYGDSGPVVSSFAALEEYLVTQGREWERYAWIKGRALMNTKPGDEAGLMELVRPFVFRKYLDYGALAAMRDLHAQIRREVARRELADNIKLGPGGIREIEFIAQVFQLIRGGKEKALQLRPTRAALDLIEERQLLPHNTVRDLREAYAFLRNLEHRLQYLDDAQTQMLPENETDRALIAESMGWEDWSAFRTALDSHRKKVDAYFQEVFADDQREMGEESAIWLASIGREEALADLVRLGYTQAETVWDNLTRLRESQRYLALPEASRARFDRLVPLMLRAAASFPNPEATLERMLTLLETISRRSAYLALLTEYPDTLTHVARVCSASPWAAHYLTGHPILLDELLDHRTLLDKPDWPALAQELRESLGDQIDPERQMDALRNFKHAWNFRILAQDLEGVLPIEVLADELAALADLLLNEVLRLCWLALTKRHREQPKFAIIGYGKLGGKEMGYASDLDIIFLYDDPADVAQEIYGRLAARINTWLTTLTSAGTLYDTDLRLRPEGASGLMVSSIAAFRQYQEKDAWLWEHQALTRARFVAGDADVGKQFEQIRRGIICKKRDLTKLREEIVGMRQKMLDAHPNNSNLFDLKHDRGGIIDVEFMVQYLVLAHAHAHPELADNVGNLALLKRAGKAGLIPDDLAEKVRDAYRSYRRLQHTLRMGGGEYARIEPEKVAAQTSGVLDLWDRLLG